MSNEAPSLQRSPGIPPSRALISEKPRSDNPATPPPASTDVRAAVTQGPRAALAAKNSGSWIIEVVKRTEMDRFVVLPKRWIVERTNAWVSINRRLMRDFERYARTVAAFIRLAMIKIMLRRLTRAIACP